MISASRNSQSGHIVVLTVFCAVILSLDMRDASSEEAERSLEQAALIARSFEEPLLTELLRKGYSPRNAAAASKRLVDLFAECWSSDSNEISISEQQTVVIKLGGKTIVTYESPCLTEFLGDVQNLP